MARLLKSTATVGSMTLISRIFGFLRDVVIARSFGAGPLTDAFFVALRIPNLLRRWFAEGAFSMAFVPVLSELREKRSHQDLRAFLGAIGGTLAVAVSAVVALGMLLAPALIYMFAPGLTDDPLLADEAARLLRITFPYALFIAMTAFAAGVLNTWGHFAIPALTPVLLNVFMILGALYLAPLLAVPIEALAWAVALAGLAQLLFQIPSLIRLGLLPRLTFAPRDREVRRVIGLMIPVLFGSSVAQLNILVDTLLASLVSKGAISWLYYSDRLLEFPLGVVGIAISTVALPALSARRSAGDEPGFARTVSWSLQLGMAISVPAAAGLLVLSYPIVATLFQYGAFTELDARMCAASLTAYALGLPAYVAIKSLVSAHYARQDTRTPVRAAVIALITNVVLNLLFLWLFARFTNWPGHAALALASSCSAYLNAGLLWIALRRRIVFPASAASSALFWRIALATTTMIAVLLLMLHYGSTVSPTMTAWNRALHLGLLVATGALAYGGVLAVFRADRLLREH